jgi:hypothetical protein
MTKRPLYVCIPRDVAKYPPIAHRGGDADRCLLAPFEFAVLAGVLAGARSALSHARHGAAMKHGLASVDRERQYHDEFKANWKEVEAERLTGNRVPAPMRRSMVRLENVYKPPRFNKAHVKRVAREGYGRARQQLRHRPPPEIVKVTASRHALLRLAGLPKNGAYLRRLDGALDRLRDVVGYRNEAPAVAPLRDWSEQQKLELRVSGVWLQKPFVRVALPLPLRSATALALWLFLPITAEGGQTGFDHVCRRLGIPDYGSAVGNRALNNALAVVNAHLQAFSDDALRALAQQDIDLPECWEIEPDDDGHTIGFKAIPIQWPDPSDDDGVTFDADEDDDEGAIAADEVEADDDSADDDEPAVIKRRHRPAPQADDSAISGGDFDADDPFGEADDADADAERALLRHRLDALSGKR